MGGRTGKEPSVDDTFLWRICHALDEPPRMLAQSIGVPYAEVEPLLDERHHLAEIDRDEVWWLILQYTSKRMGHLIAIRTELNKALQRDRKKRLLRADRFEKLHKHQGLLDKLQEEHDEKER